MSYAGHSPWLPAHTGCMHLSHCLLSPSSPSPLPPFPSPPLCTLCFTAPPLVPWCPLATPTPGGKPCVTPKDGQTSCPVSVHVFHCSVFTLKTHCPVPTTTTPPGCVMCICVCPIRPLRSWRTLLRLVVCGVPFWWWPPHQHCTTGTESSHSSHQASR